IMRILGVLPARYKSTRFEGKPLVSIAGVPMIKRTCQRAMLSDSLDEVVVATEDERIEQYCRSENIPVVMTSDSCLTGTDRIAEVAEMLDYDFYINIQGDEPVIDPVVVDQLVEQYKKHGDSYIAYNLYKIISDQKEIQSNTIVKVVVNALDELMYMSRLPVPFSNVKGVESVYRQQIPVYGFTKQALKVFAEQGCLGKTINEQFEDVELLRFVDLGYKLKMTETTADSIAVDVPDDIKKVERFLSQ
ncbi:3-deoxy-manno-octulosonate cytidylyltransferase, partial [Oleiphilus sp. HI0067]|uniref:3-deoxy-manno-octulosonate cytidylyltransferase n=3 Tax=Oleiphilus TaxID=141450 RepID=UPI000AEF3ECF